jgi:outer membrane lipoprotein-sorting protein
MAMIAGLVVAIAGGTAIAVAASSGGPVPRREPLANAIRQALAAPTVNGISARVTFTNHLIDASDLQGTDPILQGASGRLWLSTDHRLLRLELQSDNGDAQAVVNNGSFWVYDPSSNTVYEGKLPAQHAAADTTARRRHKASDRLPSVREIQTQLNDAMQHALLSGAIPSDVAGQPTYTVRVAPKHDGGLLGAAELAWDSVHGVPLRAAVYARGDNSPVLELKATDISYGAVSKSVFAISPPSGAKVVTVSAPGSRAGHRGIAADRRRAAVARKQALDVTGLSAVQHHLSFQLLAPSTLVGLPRQSVTLLDWGGTPAALVTYGQHLGGIAVIEQTEKASAASAGQSSGGDRRGLNLPTVSINGATGEELDTALGTMVRFTKAGVSYTVLGSVPPAAADAAARAL